MKRYHLIVLLIIIALVAVGTTMDALPQNIALNAGVTVSPAPNYARAGNDPKSLTDGAYTSGQFWTQPTTVGWANAEHVSIILDLGAVKPISGVSFSTAAGAGQVEWPSVIMMLVSEDSKAWSYAGDLVAISAEHSLPPSTGYATFRYVTHDLKTNGRYLQLLVYPVGQFVFTDEIEVYGGSSDTAVTATQGEPVTNIDSMARTARVRGGVTYRLRSDAASVRTAVRDSGLPQSEKDKLSGRLDDIVKAIPTVPIAAPEQFRAILPENDLHAGIFAVYGDLLRAQGVAPLTVWKKDRYDSVALVSAPPTGTSGASVDMTMAQNEYRSDALLLTNATGSQTAVSVRVEGIDGAPRPTWLSVYTVPWTDTSRRVPVSAALVDAEFANGAYQAQAPAGMTIKLWLTVDSSKLAPGTHRGSLVVSGAGQETRVPFSVYVSPIRMNQPRFSLTMWDYCCGSGYLGITPANMPSAISLMRSHFVDSPWAMNVLSAPSASSFAPDGRMTTTPAFTSLNQWVAAWSGARHYFAVSPITGRFAGSAMGSPEFESRVGEWAKALAADAQTLGLGPKQLGLLLQDEPDETKAVLVVACAKAIRSSGAGIAIFQDIDLVNPSPEGTLVQALELSDYICPNSVQYYLSNAGTQAMYERLRSEGKSLWFYRTAGPTKTFDPYRYYRLTAWDCFRHGATGMGFWSFGDTGGSVSSWNEYTAVGTPYSPVFLSPDSVTNGVHWDAAREGVEDYEYLAMLRDACGKTQDPALRAQAEKLLGDGVNSVVGTFKAQPEWSEDVDRSQADNYRIRVLKLLEKMR